MSRARPALLLAGLAALAVAIAAARAYRDRDYRPDFARAAGELVRVEDSTGVALLDDGTLVTDVTLVSDTGLRALVRVRATGTLSGERYPAIILLGGFRSGRSVVALPAIPPDLVVASVEYPYDGPRRSLGAWGWIHRTPALRSGALETPAAVLLAAQYLYARNDVDPERVAVVGASLGAPFAVAAAATDRRLAGVALIHGGGDVRRLLTGAYGDRGPRWVVGGLAWIVAWLTAPLEPVKYVDDLPPRPLLMVNAVEDEMVPRESVLALWEAAGRPKRLEWLEGRHVSSNAEVVQVLMDRTLLWMEDVGLR